MVTTDLPKMPKLPETTKKILDGLTNNPPSDTIDIPEVRVRATGMAGSKENQHRRTNSDVNPKNLEMERKTSLHRRTNSLGLSQEIENSIEQLKTSNPKYINRLSGFFKELTKLGIDVNQEMISLVSQNVTSVNPFVKLVNFMHDHKIGFKEIGPKLLFEAAPDAENLLNGLHSLSEAGLTSSNTFKLMLQHSKHALPLSQLLIDLDSTSYDGEPIENRLSQFSKELAGSAFDLLNFVLEQGIFYPDLLNLFLNHEQQIPVILEGAQKLRDDKSLLVLYFDRLDKNPANAVNFAKSLLLLKSASLLDSLNIEAVQNFSAGEYMFLKILDRSHSLDSQIFADICRNHSLFAREDVQDALNHVPLFSALNGSELDTLRSIIRKGDDATIPEINKFISLIEVHHLMPVEAAGRKGPTC